MSKLRVVGQALPVPSAPAVGTIFVVVPADGTASLPSRISLRAALKKLVPLQNDTWPKTDPAWPLTQLPCCSAAAVAPTWNRSVPLNPNSMVTIAAGGSVGTVGVMTAVGPWAPTSGL